MCVCVYRRVGFLISNLILAQHDVWILKDLKMFFYRVKNQLNIAEKIFVEVLAQESCTN